MKLGSAIEGLVFALCVLAASCGDSGDSCVNGSGPIISQTLDLSALTGVDFQTGGAVTVSLGTTQQVMVRGEENVIDVLNTDVINGVWEVGFDQCVNNISDLRIDITVPEFTSAELSGAGTITAETNATQFDTTLTGAGTITVLGSSTVHNLALEGSGTIEAFELVATEAVVDLSGEGTVNVRAEEQLSVDLSGAGAVFYKGDPTLDIRISGAGDVVDAN